ncbi:MAG: type IV toxin-antitoxin system AbiEi family antitoxin domain-containing protein [Thermoplasmatota archaeon]
MNKDNKKARGLLAELARERVLTTDALARKLASDSTRAARVARSLRARGLLKNVRRGVYAVVPLESDPARYSPDPILAVHAALGDSYVFSHFTALQLHGAEHNAHKTIHVTKPAARSRRLRVGDTDVHMHGAPARGWDAATATMKRGRATLRVTTPERTIFDLVALPPRQQDYDEIVTAFRDLKSKLNIRHLVAETLAWGNTTTRARMGHLLTHAADLGEPDPFGGKIGEFTALKSPFYFGTRPTDPANRVDKTFNVVYPERA